MDHPIDNLDKQNEKLAQIEFLSKRKLVLFVDLDLTMINSISKLKPGIPPKPDFELEKYLVFVRPGLEEFLHNVSVHYEMYLTTYAQFNYAQQIIEHVDPFGQYFKQNIFSKTYLNKYEDKCVFYNFITPLPKSFVCVVDDKNYMWSIRGNVISVKPFRDLKNDKVIIDGTTEQVNFLKLLESQLINVHKDFFAKYDANSELFPDTGEILNNFRNGILDGAKIYFNEPDLKDVLMSHEGNIIRSLGGHVSSEFNDTVTHFVSRFKFYSDAIANKLPNIKCVTNNWIYACNAQLKRCEETQYIPDDEMPGQIQFTNIGKTCGLLYYLYEKVVTP